jgi:Asp-tRNA(Asn)/Glu-tRNA(Gln) amidotransferase A subunit family amidase
MTSDTAKDLIDIAGVRTERGSLIYKGRIFDIGASLNSHGIRTPGKVFD